MELAKSFEPHPIEDKWYPIWEERGYFKPDYKPGAPSFCIQTGMIGLRQRVDTL